MCEYGKPSTQCGFCKAELWFQERATISTTNNHIDDILRRAPKSTFSTIYFADEVMEDKGCED
ncbi:hypothetical protein JHK86_033845 [Glycine max]|nr:hypothetical protein JHK86_033845 [Glycine max]